MPVFWFDYTDVNGDKTSILVHDVPALVADLKATQIRKAKELEANELGVTVEELDAKNAKDEEAPPSDPKPKKGK